MQLYNTLSAEERAELIDQAGKQRLTLSFYAYAKIEDPKKFRDDLFIEWNKLDALGRTYVAKEGINAQMSVPAENLEAFRETLEAYEFMRNIRLNVAVEHDDHSFLKLTVKVRDKIVADGLNDETFDVTNIGVHLKAKEFNEILEDPNTIVVDFRNHYESEIGHFKGAITPDVETFRESLPIINEQLQDFKEDKNLVMYCTGGIRCEKASAYFKHQGFKNVFQLEGGIINLPLVEQVKLRKGKQVGNKVFRKGKSDKLPFKHSGDLPDAPLAMATTPTKIRQRIKIKKALLGKAEHYFVKAQVALFMIESNELQVGDTILISGPTTGNEQLVLEKMLVNGIEKTIAQPGDKVTFEVPFRVRLSDTLFKILN